MLFLECCLEHAGKLLYWEPLALVVTDTRAHRDVRVTYTFTTCIGVFINAVICWTYTCEVAHCFYTYCISSAVVATSSTFRNICCVNVVGDSGNVITY